MTGEEMERLKEQLHIVLDDCDYKNMDDADKVKELRNYATLLSDLKIALIFTNRIVKIKMEELKNTP